MAQGSNKQLGPHLDVIQSITHMDLRITRKFIEDGQHTLKVKLPVDARNVPEAGYGNLTHGGNVIAREAETSLLHPPPISLVESYVQERVSDLLRVTGSEGGLGFFARDHAGLMIIQFLHEKRLAALQRMRHNAGHQPRPYA